jgi:hypothetical protein
MRPAPRSHLLLAAALVAVATDAAAQGRSARPYRGLFASGVENTRQSLIANVSIGGGWDDNILLDLPGVGGQNPSIAEKGSVGSLDGSVSYSAQGRRGILGASLGSSLRYYPSQLEPYVQSHGANVGGSVRLGSRTSLSGGQSLTYQPFTFLALLPVLAPASVDGGPDAGDLGASVPRGSFLDQATSRAEYLAYSTNAAFGHQLSSRVTFYSSYVLQRSDTAFLGGSFSSQSGRGGFDLRLTRGLSARLGYMVQDARLVGGTRGVRMNNADIGLNYNRALSFSRRTTLSFSSGTSALSSGSQTTYQLVGGASLTHELGRTWTALANYGRSVQLVDLLLLPVISDSIQTSVQGLVNRRVQAQAGFLASIGTIGFGDSGRAAAAGNGTYDTLQASAGLGYALSRHVQMGVNYAFFRYRFERTILLPQGVPQNVDRQSIRVNLRLWAPIVNRARR